MKKITTDRERTEEYLKNFNHEKLLKLLVNHESPVIFDVGANEGVTISEFKAWWPQSTIHCFEPQEECWANLDRAASCYPESIFVNKIGVGAEKSSGLNFYSHKIEANNVSGKSGFHRINIESKDSIRLSELRNADEELVSYKESLNHSRTIPLITLADYIAEKNIEKINLLKIDTQGYEPEVLCGLENSLKQVDVVISELMFYDFYERSLSFSDIEQYLLPAGFQLYDISHISKNPMNGRTDWVDVIYVNNSVIR